MRYIHFFYCFSMINLLSLLIIHPANGQSISTASITTKEKVRLLVQFNQQNPREKESFMNQYKVRWDFHEFGFTIEVHPQQLEELKKRSDLRIQEVEKVYTLVQPSIPKVIPITFTPSDSVPWGVKAIYHDSSIKSTSGGNEIRVAVLNTGVYKHKDLISNIEQCKDFTDVQGMKNGMCDDKNGHGTHVAGTVLANGGDDGKGIYGVSPEAKLWAYKVLGDNGSGYADDIAAAIFHAADESKRLGVRTVLSLSLGSVNKDPLITEAISYAKKQGVLIIAAAGNDGPELNSISYPGALPHVIAVAALENVQEKGTYRVADFSSRGDPNTAGDYLIQERDIEVSAPGAWIESTWLYNSYNKISGTSMATPHISGLAAKIWADHPDWSHEKVRKELQLKAKKYDILGGIYAKEGDDVASGFGFPTVQ